MFMQLHCACRKIGEVVAVFDDDHDRWSVHQDIEITERNGSVSTIALFLDVHSAEARAAIEKALKARNPEVEVVYG